MLLGTQLLIDRGRRRFGLINGPPSFASSHGRRDGVIDALAAAGLDCHSEEVGAFTVQSGYDAVRRMSGVSELDALICANDAMAIGALSALQNLGRSVPTDISVIGFDDIAMAGWPAFGLTTLRNPIDALVRSVVGLVQRRGETPEKPDETIYLSVDLVLRCTH
jgi:DNA-binding LacI/PurR family transcriptional regulator